MFGRLRRKTAESQDVASLLKASLQGSTQAFEVIVGRYQSLVCTITYSATGSVEKSEELAQETFLRAWKSLDQLRDPAKFRGWLCSIARSTVQNWFRSRRQDVVGKAAPLDCAAEKASEETGPVEAAMTKEQQAVVAHALARIPELLREPLILFYREQKSVREVAEQLGVSENAARQRISRGRSMLREQVADIVETTIARTKPGRAFTTAVIAAVAATAAKTATTAAAATGAAAILTGSSSTTTVLSGVTAKVVALAAGVAIITGSVVTYKHLTRPEQLPVTSSHLSDGPSAEGILQPKANESQASGVASSSVVPAVDRDSALRTPYSELVTPAAERDRSRAAAAPAQVRLYEFVPKGVLSGRITDADTGEPVRDAMVQISMSRIFYARTDSNGFYSLDSVHEAGSFQVSVFSLEYVGIERDAKNPAVYLSNDKQAIKHFQLPKACIVDVWVTDPNGVPLPKTNVVVTSLVDDRSREIGDSARLRQTDPNGYILLGGIPAARTDYLITVWRTTERKPGEMRSEYAYAPAGIVLQLNDPNVVKQVRVALLDGQNVHGYAQYADGAPAGDIEISPTPAWWHCNYSVLHVPVDPNGTFILKHITPGTYKIGMYVPRPDKLGGTLSTIAQTQLPPDDRQPLVVQIPGKSPLSLASISGKLIFVGEKKPDSLEITASSPSGSAFTNVLRKPNGELNDTFTVDRLEPGTYTLQFSGTNAQDKTIPNVVAPSEGLEVEVVYAAKPQLAGTVVDGKTGEPIRHFRVRVRKIRMLRGPNYTQQERWTQVGSEQGSFNIETVGPGVYQVQAVADGYAPRWSEEINTDRPGQTTIALSPGGTVTGMVVNDKGEPIDGAKVIPLSLAGGAMPQTKDLFVCQEGAATTSAGTFTLKNLPSGVETLGITHADYASGIVDNIAVAEGKTTDGVRVTLTPGGTVEGYVYDDQGKPQAAQAIYFRDDSGYSGSADEAAGLLGSAVTDSNGFYQVSHLPEKLAYVTRGDGWSGNGVVCRVVAPSNGEIIRLDFGGTPLVSGLVVLDGAPLAKARLLLGDTDSYYSRSFRCFTTTDEQGAFIFRGVSRGTHAVYYARPDRQNDWLKIATFTVADTNTDLGVIPHEASSLMLTIDVPEADSAWQIENVSIADSDRPTVGRFREARAPTVADGPWLIENVPAGPYTLTVVRRDGVRWRTQIDLQAGQGPWQVSVTAPQGSAKVSGRVLGDANWLALWREGKDLWSLILARSGAQFSIADLPAGRYFIGNDPAFLAEMPALMEFTLGEGEDNVIDVDTSGESGDPMGFLLVLVVDEKAVPRNDVHAWLEGPHGTVEPLEWSVSGYCFAAAPGQYTLRVEAAGYRPVRTRITLRPFGPAGSKAQTTTVHLQP